MDSMTMLFYIFILVGCGVSSWMVGLSNGCTRTLEILKENGYINMTEDGTISAGDKKCQ
jgi:hypothetical protein